MEQKVSEREFKMGVVYDHHIDNISFGNISQNVLVEKFKDGRVFGLIAEIFVATTFNNLICSGDNKTYWDVQTTDNLDKFEVRVLTRNGVDFLPSKMKGIGREFNQDGFYEKLNLIKGFIIVDIRNLPNMCISSIESNTIKNLNIKKYTCKQAYDKKLTAYKY